MPSRISLLALVGALLLGGCGGWLRDPPPGPAGALDPVPVAEPGYPDPATADLAPPPLEPAAGSSYAAPTDARPRTRRDPPAIRRPLPAEPDAMPPPPASRYDNVGYAVWSNEAGTVAAAHPTLPPGSFAEVTALDTGRTIIVPITATARSGREIELSGTAAQELGLGLGGDAPVRVRAANPTGADLTALRAGRPAQARPDTPPVLLNALRHKLTGTQGQPAPVRQATPPPPARPIPRPSPPARPPATPAAAKTGPGYYVQVAALSDATRAAAVARSVGGVVRPGGGLYRVRFGPFDDLRTAQAARDEVAGRGYGDARIVRED